jgi:hypothetical protein
VADFAAELAGRHGGIDIVFSNHYHRTILPPSLTLM